MAFNLITLTILLLSVSCLAAMVYQLSRQPAVHLSFWDYSKLITSGVIAFIADTLGVGSSVVNVAFAKLFGTFRDDELPAVNNGAQILPGTIESLFFMQLMDVELTTLLTFVMGACIGGLMGAVVVSRLSQQTIRLAMMGCFLVIISLLLCHQFYLLPTDGDLVELHSWQLLIGFGAMIICGAFASVGIGLFAMVQGVLFLLGVSPLVAFPIMTIMGAMQQPLITFVFLKQKQIPLKKTLIVSLAGCIGVLIILPIFNQLTITWLHSLLLVIVIYNFLAIARTYIQSTPYANASRLDDEKNRLTECH